MCFPSARSSPRSALWQSCCCMLLGVLWRILDSYDLIRMCPYSCGSVFGMFASSSMSITDLLMAIAVPRGTPMLMHSYANLSSLSNCRIHSMYDSGRFAIFLASFTVVLRTRSMGCPGCQSSGGRTPPPLCVVPVFIVPSQLYTELGLLEWPMPGPI